MRIGPNPPHPILSKALDSKHGLRWLLLVCTLLYGLLDSNPGLLPGFETLQNKLLSVPGGMPVTVQDSAYVRLLLPTTPVLIGSGSPRPKRLICLVPMKGSARTSLNPLESAQGLAFPPQTLDTITCWEAHER